MYMYMCVNNAIYFSLHCVGQRLVSLGWKNEVSKFDCNSITYTVQLSNNYEEKQYCFDSHENYQPSRTKYRLIYQENTTLVIIKKCII